MLCNTPSVAPHCIVSLTPVLWFLPTQASKFFVQLDHTVVVTGCVIGPGLEDGQEIKLVFRQDPVTPAVFPTGFISGRMLGGKTFKITPTPGSVDCIWGMWDANIQTWLLIPYMNFA